MDRKKENERKMYSTDESNDDDFIGADEYNQYGQHEAGHVASNRQMVVRIFLTWI